MDKSPDLGRSYDIVNLPSAPPTFIGFLTAALAGAARLL
jgi:hypothetical protein